MRVKSIAVFLVVLVLMILLSLWQVDRAFYNEQTSQGEGAARAQLASIIPGLQAEYRSLGEHVKLVSSQTVDRSVFEFNDGISYRLEMIAKLRPTDSGEFIFENKSFHERTAVRSWAENYTTIALKAIKPKDVAADGSALVALMDPQRKPFFLWIFRDPQDRWSAVITKPTVLQSLMDRQKGLFGTVIVVNQQGQVLGHTTSEYVGTSMAEDPVVKQLMTSGRRNHSGFYREANGAMAQGYFEIVPASNTYVALSRPMVPLQKSRDAIRWQLILLGCGFLFVGLAAFVYVQRNEPQGGTWKSPLAKPAPKPTPGLNPNPAAAPTTKGPDPKASEGSADLLKERMKAYTTSASALARELHGPIARILGLTHVLTGKNLPQETQTEISEIEELARNSRAILRKLLSFAGEEEYQIEPTGMNETIQRALSSLETKLNSKGIKIEKHLKRVAQVKGNSVGLAKCLEAILLNSIESMERMPTKRITMDLESSGNWVILKIRDTGEGIPPENIDKVFDPFFSLKNRSIHSGLGLSMSLGVIHEFGGEIQIQSEAGQGTLVELRLPIHPEGAKLDEVVDGGDPVPAPPPAPVSAPAVAKDLAIAKDLDGDLSEKTVTLTKTQVPVDVPKAPPAPPAGLKKSNEQQQVRQPTTSQVQMRPEGSKVSPPPPPASGPKLSPAEKMAKEIEENARQLADNLPARKVPPLPPQAPNTPPSKPPPAVARPSLLHERAIQETLDAIDNLDEPMSGKKVMPPPPPAPRSAEPSTADEAEQFVEKKLTEKSSPPPIRGTEHSVSIKIDRPQIGITLAKPKIGDVAVRKPGEKTFPDRPGGRR